MEWFHKFAHKVSNWAGHPTVFLSACVVIIVWALSGPIFSYSDTWQLIINTGTTIITFLMVFLIQNTQNRDSRAIHLKLDELIRVNKHAHSYMIDLEELSDRELDEVHKQITELKVASEKRLVEITEHRKRKNRRRNEDHPRL